MGKALTKLGKHVRQNRMKVFYATEKKKTNPIILYNKFAYIFSYSFSKLVAT